MNRRRELLILCALVGASLLPFVSKPVHIDDPMYLWAARQISEHPADFYGFDVNWYGFSAPMYEINKNPPLVSYYQAATGATLGWGEVGQHLGMIVPALALVLGTFALARQLCGDPLLAALASFAMPVTLVSSTTLMSDVLMLALWVWACVFWLRGLSSGRAGELVVAAVLMGLCPLAKYFGLALLPLLAAYALARERRLGAWTITLLVPLAIVGGYELYTLERYGWDPLGDIGSYALTLQSIEHFALHERALVGLAFTGGCLLGTLLFAPWLWPRVGLAGGVVVLCLLWAGLPLLGTLGGFPLGAGLSLHVAVFAVAGAHVLLLAGADLQRTRDAEGLLLALWVGGVFVFCAFTNWTATGRSVLPMAPAVGILLARALATRSQPMPQPLRAAALAAGLCVALAVAYGDLRAAATARDAARTLAAQHGGGSRALYFQGGWGFQYYMEEQGAQRLSFDGLVLRPGDLVVAPRNGSNVIDLGDSVRTLEQVEFPVSRWVATMSPPAGAGFYAALRGPVPFAFGPAPHEVYTVQQVVKPARLER